MAGGLFETDKVKDEYIDMRKYNFRVRVVAKNLRV